MPLSIPRQCLSLLLLAIRPRRERQRWAALGGRLIVTEAPMWIWPAVARVCSPRCAPIRASRRTIAEAATAMSNTTTDIEHEHTRMQICLVLPVAPAGFDVTDRRWWRPAINIAPVHVSATMQSTAALDCSPVSQQLCTGHAVDRIAFGFRRFSPLTSWNSVTCACHKNV